MSDEGAASDTSVPEDVLVAGAAASGSIALTLVSQYVFDVPVGVFVRLAPLVVYPLYVLFGRGDTGSVVEDPRLWAGAAVLVTIVAFGFAL